MSAFRELRYGVLFYLITMGGCVVGWLVGNPPGVVSGDRDDLNRQAAILALMGAVAFGSAWLFHKYNFLTPPKN